MKKRKYQSKKKKKKKSKKKKKIIFEILLFIFHFIFIINRPGLFRALRKTFLKPWIGSLILQIIFCNLKKI